MNNIIIIGAGQYGMVVKEIAQSLGYDNIGFLDDNSEMASGRICEMACFSDEYKNAAVAIGNAELRQDLLSKLEKAGFELPVLIHKSSYISPSAVIGKGTVIEPLAVVNAGVKIGKGCFISAGAVMNHNCNIGDYCHIDCGTIVGARSVVKSKTNTKYGEIITE